MNNEEFIAYHNKSFYNTILIKAALEKIGVSVHCKQSLHFPPLIYSDSPKKCEAPDRKGGSALGSRVSRTYATSYPGSYLRSHPAWCNEGLWRSEAGSHQPFIPVKRFLSFFVPMYFLVAHISSANGLLLLTII